MMKKSKLFLLAAVMAYTTTVKAESNAPAATSSWAQDKTITATSFWDNWYLQAGYQYGSFLGGQEWKKSILKKFHTSPGTAIAIGKQFTPVVGVRLKINGIWGKWTANDEYARFFRYWHLQVQPTLNLSNLLCGYKPTRFYTLSLFGGAGFARNMTYNKYAMSWGVGILNNFRISNRLSVNIEAGWNRLENDFDGVTGTSAGTVDAGHRGWDSHDNILYAEIGLQVNLGRTGFHRHQCKPFDTSTYERQIRDLNGQLETYRMQSAEMVREMRYLLDKKDNEIKEHKQSVKEFITTPVSVFFEKGKAVVANEKDIVNIRALAQYAMKSGHRLLVTGYADSATGTEDINNRLSKSRAEAVRDRLVKLGMKPDQIVIRYRGGVHHLDPADFNRRATVQLYKADDYTK